MSYAYYYLYNEKSPNDKQKGAHHTPGRGVVGTLRLVIEYKIPKKCLTLGFVFRV
jgi:hypothetical protein